MVYVLAGKGRYLDVEHRDLPLHPGDLMFMFPGHGYRYLADPGEPWSEVYLQFQYNFRCVAPGRRHDPRPAGRHLEPIAYWHRRLCEVVSMNGTNDAARTLTAIVSLQALRRRSSTWPSSRTQRIGSGWPGHNVSSISFR